MTRGEVWWARLTGGAGHRPVVLLSRERAYRVRTIVTVAPTTRTVWGIPVEVPLGPVDGMPHPCVVNLDNIQTIGVGQLERRITQLSPERMRHVSRAIFFALGLDQDV